MKLAIRFFLGCLLLAGLAGCRKTELPSVNVFITADIEGVFWSRPEPRYANEVTGGFSILKSFLDKQTEPFLLLEGGNWFASTPEGTLSQGAYFNTVAARIPYTGRMFTEKDLIYGWGSLSHILKDSPSPFILSNVTLPNGKLPAGMKPWSLKEVGGYKIGILGILSTRALQGKQRTSGLVVHPEIQAARDTVQLLRDKGAQAIIMLAALDTQAGPQRVTAADVAEEVGGIDVMIVSNVGREAAETSRAGKTLVVYAGSRFDSIGRVKLFFNSNSEVAEMRFEDIILYRRDFGEDEEIAAKVAALRRAAQNELNRPVGSSNTQLTGNLQGESALGDWAADCMRKWAKTDIAVLNAASLRDVLPQGQITQYDLYKVYPYADHVTYLTMKGQALLNALEQGLAVPDNFAQISGLQIRYSPSAPQGKRILSMRVNGAPIVPTATYRVAVTDHMLAGGAGHDGFIDSLEFKNTQVEMRNVLRFCLPSSKPISAPPGGRWKVNS